MSATLLIQRLQTFFFNFVHVFFSFLTFFYFHLSVYYSYDLQGGHSPGKPGKVREFRSGQGKVRENRKSQEKCVLACTKFGQLVLRKIIEIVATIFQTLRVKYIKLDFGWGSAPDPAELTALPRFR